MHAENTLTIADSVGNERSLRVSPSRNLPIAIATGGAAGREVGVDGQARMLFRPRNLCDRGEHVGRERPACFVGQRTSVREERSANDLVDCRALGRLLEYGREHATNRVAVADILDCAADAMQLRPIRRIDRGTGFGIRIHEAQDRESGEN